MQDELGSPIRIVGEVGNTKARYSYDAFGRPIIPVNLISRSKTKGNIDSYTGYQYDLSTRLMYAQARYYMPEVGRFISVDAYKGTVADPQSLNLYVYCGNNPMNYVDPSGYMEIEDKKVLNKQDYAIMQSLTHLYGMYEAEGNTTLKESIRAKAVSIRQQAKYSGKCSISDKQGTYLDNYQYKSDYHYNASKYIDAEYITKERIYVYGGSPQTIPQKVFETGKQAIGYAITAVKVVQAKKAVDVIKAFIPGPVDTLDNVGQITQIDNDCNYVGKRIQEGDVRIRVGNCYQGTTYWWFREKNLWHQEPYDNNWFM